MKKYNLIRAINNMKLKKKLLCNRRIYKLEELLSIYEKSLDLLIIDIIKFEKLYYIDGILELIKIDEYININIKLFFRSSEDILIMKELFDKIHLYQIIDKDAQWTSMKYRVEHPKL